MMKDKLPWIRKGFGAVHNRPTYVRVYHFTKELSFNNSLWGSNELDCSLFIPHIEHVCVLGVPRHTEHSLPLLWLYTESDGLHGALRVTRTAVEGYLRHTSVTGEEDHPHAAGFLCLLRRGEGYYCKCTHICHCSQWRMHTQSHTHTQHIDTTLFVTRTHSYINHYTCVRTYIPHTLTCALEKRPPFFTFTTVSHPSLTAVTQARLLRPLDRGMASRMGSRLQPLALQREKTVSQQTGLQDDWQNEFAPSVTPYLPGWVSRSMRAALKDSVSSFVWEHMQRMLHLSNTPRTSC